MESLNNVKCSIGTLYLDLRYTAMLVILLFVDSDGMWQKKSIQY